VRERDGGRFVRTYSPGSGVRRSESRIREAIADEFAPNVAGPVGATAAVNIGGMILDADSDEADPLGDFGALVTAVGRCGQFGMDLRPRGLKRNASKQQEEPFAIFHRTPYETQTFIEFGREIPQEDSQLLAKKIEHGTSVAVYL